MQLIIRQPQTANSRVEVAAVHNGEEVIWSIGPHDKVFLDSKQKFDMFEHINAYWHYRGPELQDQVFKTYKEIRFLFDDGHDRNQLTRRLYEVVARLVDMHDLDDIEHWISYHRSNIVFPDTSLLKTDYVASVDKPGTRDQTYILSDYQKLVAMAIALRVMVPVWCDFISRTRQEAGTNFKEYYAFRLIGESKLMASEAMRKLTTYVELATVTGKDKPASIIGGISSADFPRWILGLVVVRKVAIGDISGVDNNTLVTYIYHFIQQRITGVDNNFNGTAGIIRPKNFDELSPDGENNLSRLEGYKVKQEIPAGDIVALEHSVVDSFSVAYKLEPTIDKGLVQRSLQTSSVLNRERITEAQILMLQWVMKPVIPTKGILYLNKATVVRLLGVCQAVLIHRGHIVLAGLCTATIGRMDNDEIYTSGVDSRARIPKEMIDEINLLFPYMKRQPGRQKTQKLSNPALTSIDEMTDLLTQFNWVLTIEDQYVKELTRNVSQRWYAIPHDIKVMLAALVLQITKLQR